MTFDYNAFIDQHLFILYLGIVLVGVSIVLFEVQSKKTTSVLLLILGAMALRVFVALIDPFLHMWDEQIHALVAKNMMDNPFKPTLINDPIFHVDFKNWTENHIWLHKQPFFLWQIALSFKLFGVNEFTLRLPGIFMSGLIVFFIYRIGKIAYSKHAGFYGAVLFAGSNYLIELTAGRMPTDHNDIAFLFYITASIWAWFEYSKSRNKYWILIIGLFSGFAILVKWLTGLLVYSGWFFAIILQREWRHDRGYYIDLLKSLFVTGIVALPWQIFILIRFPLESKYEYTYNSLHFFEALEGHSGSWLYHFEAIKEIYGFSFHYIIYTALIIFCLIRIKKGYKIPLLTWIMTAYIFFTLAATKMMGFTTIVAPLIYLTAGIVIAFLVDTLNNYFNHDRQKKWLSSIISVALIFYLFLHFVNHDKLSLENTPTRKIVYEKVSNTRMFYKELNTLFPDGDFFFFNPLPTDPVKIMFYSGYRSRKGIPSEKDIKKLKDYPIRIVVFDNGRLPDYVLNDKVIAKVKSVVWMKEYQGMPEIYY